MKDDGGPTHHGRFQIVEDLFVGVVDDVHLRCHVSEASKLATLEKLIVGAIALAFVAVYARQDKIITPVVFVIVYAVDGPRSLGEGVPAVHTAAALRGKRCFDVMYPDIDAVVVAL